MNAWKVLIKMGCDRITGLTRGRVLMLNGVMILASVSVLLFSVSYAVIGYRYFYGPLYFLPVALVVFIYNYIGRYSAARKIYLVGSFVVICYWCYEGRGNGNEYTLIGLAITSTLLFTEKFIVYLINIICAMAFVVYQYLHATSVFTPDPALNYHVLPWVILANTIGVIVFQIAFYRDLVHHYDRQLTIKYDEQVLLLQRQQIIDAELVSTNSKLREISDQLELKVKQKTAELQAYIEAVRMNTFSTVSDLYGNFIAVNDLIVEISGYSKEELIGAHYDILSSGRHPPEFFVDRRSSLMKGNAWRGEVEHKIKDGTLLWFDCVVIPIRNQNGVIDSFLTLGLPITERKLNEKIKEDTHKLLENIAFRASHNIRGPLARIKGLADLALRGLLERDELRMVAERLNVCSDELYVATTELVSFVNDHQELISEVTDSEDVK